MIENLEHLDHALESGKGVVLMGSHLNSIAHFPGVYWLRKMGYDAHAVMPTQDDPLLDLLEVIQSPPLKDRLTV